MSCLNCKAEEEDEEAVECIGKVAQNWPSSNTPKGGSEEEREGGREEGGKFFCFFASKGRPAGDRTLKCSR